MELWKLYIFSKKYSESNNSGLSESPNDNHLDKCFVLNSPNLFNFTLNIEVSEWTGQKLHSVTLATY